MSIKTELQGALAYGNAELAKKGITETATTICGAFEKIQDIGEMADVPSDYTQLSYIESTGTQYIDIGLAINNIKTAIIDVARSGNLSYCCGGRASTSVSSDSFAFFLNAISIDFQYADVRFNVSSNINTSLRRTYQLPFASSPNASLPSSINFYLFAIISGDTIQYGTVRLYNVQITTINGGKYYLVPCLDNNGVPCLYDRIGKQTYYNAGTGSFLYG